MSDPLSRYCVGIDLGTTNSAVSFVDSTLRTSKVCDLQVPQVVGPGLIEARDTLPSFHYEAAKGEFPPGALRLPWDAQAPCYAVGFFARDHGATVSGRVVASAKSWLCHPGVDRTAPILPSQGAPDVLRLSPVTVSARYLGHIRNAWNHAFPKHPLETQDVALTVPASFDEVARELTVRAAVEAGLPRVTLIEEPQAAFYAWIAGRGTAWRRMVREGQRILVCDVGGGTSDFTLIDVETDEDGKLRFRRVAVGDHLILGGDNLDHALARHLEDRLSRGRKLESRAWETLVRGCCRVKEALLGEDPPPRLTVNVAVPGSRLIGSSMQAEVAREEAVMLLVEGFLPRVPLDAKPTTRRAGFQELALPYAQDPAITRHLAAFLTAHGSRGPDLVLLNGGLFASVALRERLLSVLHEWFPTAALSVLANDRLDLAVARGAAYYGMVRRGKGVRIAGGLAQTYYVGVDTGRESGMDAVCLLPAGTQEGEEVDLDRTFRLRIRQPVEFALYVSTTRMEDVPGSIVSVEDGPLTPLPPIRTVLQAGRKTEADLVYVHLHARLTEVGTIELWCTQVTQDRKWRLEFDVRATTPLTQPSTEAPEAPRVVEAGHAVACENLIRATFRAEGDGPEGLTKRLEQATGTERARWPLPLLRAMWEVMNDVAEGRRLGPGHEARWLSLTGFVLRPGFGMASDDWRVSRTYRVFHAGVLNPTSEPCRAEWWILWRRVAGGMTQGQQEQFALPFLAARRSRGPKGSHEAAERWRLLGSLERLAAERKVAIGEAAFRTELDSATLWALGRLGARVPAHGPLNTQVPAEVAEDWARRLLAYYAERTEAMATFALVHLTRRTADRHRDVSPELRAAVIAWLMDRGASPRSVELVRDGATLREEEERLVFGESLPPGLSLEAGG